MLLSSCARTKAILTERRNLLGCGHVAAFQIFPHKLMVVKVYHQISYSETLVYDRFMIAV